MLAVIFEVIPKADNKDEYLDIAGDLKSYLADIDGFISIERFQSLVDEKKLLSLSFWRDEEAIRIWRNKMEHRDAQMKGRSQIFENYRIRVAQVMRDYGMDEREQVPKES